MNRYSPASLGRRHLGRDESRSLESDGDARKHLSSWRRGRSRSIEPVRVWAERPAATSVMASPRPRMVLLDTLKSSFLLPTDRNKV